MAKNIEELYKEILELPDESKAILAEQIVEYLETHVDPGLERLHLDTVRRRRDEMRSGKVKAVDGQDAAKMARKAKDFDCVEMMHKGQEAVLKEIEGMSREQELEYWRERNSEFLSKWKHTRAQKKNTNGESE